MNPIERVIVELYMDHEYSITSITNMFKELNLRINVDEVKCTLLANNVTIRPSNFLGANQYLINRTKMAARKAYIKERYAKRKEVGKGGWR